METLNKTTSVMTDSTTDLPLRVSVDRAIDSYLTQLQDQQSVNDLYEIVLSEVEEPLLKAVMDFCRGNQSKAAILLGLSRGTLRKKLKEYDLL